MFEEATRTNDYMERKRGGRSFADAMARVYISDKKYVEHSLNAIKIRNLANVDGVNYVLGDDDFVIFKNNKIIMHETYDFVDKCRKKGAFEFEKRLCKVL